MDYLEYKGYRGSIEYSLADKCFVGQVQGLGKKVLILYEGNTIDELRKDFEEAANSTFACPLSFMPVWLPLPPVPGRLSMSSSTVPSATNWSTNAPCSPVLRLPC